MFYVILDGVRLGDFLKAVSGFRKLEYQVAQASDAQETEELAGRMLKDISGRTDRVVITRYGLLPERSISKDTLLASIGAADRGLTAVLTEDGREAGMYLADAGKAASEAERFVRRTVLENGNAEAVPAVFGNAVSEEGDIPDVIKLEPAFKDYLWGGSRLKDVYKKDTDMSPLAESWELSSHRDGESTVSGGEYDGLKFPEFLKKIGDRGIGYKAAGRDRFPLLIKFIDAMKPLSIQVHPDDAYALLNAGEYGKNEMWHIVDCEPGAYIYYGLKEDITPEELKERIENNTILDVLNRVEVKKGDTFYVRAGTIHAIGAGILICEIQQNSNCTYRIYDYDRVDKNGCRRPLHIDRAMDVCWLKAVRPDGEEHRTIHKGGVGKTVLCSSRYFESVRYDSDDEMTVKTDDASFASVIMLEGSGIVEGSSGTVYGFRPADSFFIPAGGNGIKIKGKSSFIVTKM